MSWRFLLAALALAGQPAAADEERATNAEIMAETLYAELPGPGPDEKRAVAVWRPANADGPLPVIYMADGLSGLGVVVERLRPAIRAGAVPPIMVVGFASDRAVRRIEYVAPYGHAPSPEFDRHMDWVFHTVIPWAELMTHASSDPHQRIIGGYSNGADFALVMAERHPEAFAGVLAYSPVHDRPLELDARAARLRWVLTGGRLELNGEIVDGVNAISRHIRATGASVRRCIGPWEHRLSAWRDLSPGNIAWLFNLPSADAADSPAERAYCRNPA